MKLINHFLILFLIISLTSEISINDYSINTFINDLKRNGLFEIIESIKKVYCQDVAIISCEELTENRKGNCKKLVTEYIPEYKCSDNKRTTIPTYKMYIRHKRWNPIMKHSCPKFDTKDKLNKIYNPEKLESIYHGILQRIGKRPCFNLIFNF